jgi:HAD superfamily hydrolase (TIGR01484 family)
MQPYISNCLKMAVQRISGTFIGAIYGLITILLYYYGFPDLFQRHISYYMLVSLMIVPILYTTVLIKKKNASYFSMVVFLSIVVNHIGDANPFLFVFNRVLDTLIGIALSVVINTFRLPRRKQDDILFVSDVDDTLLNEKEKLSAYNLVELNRMLMEGANFTVATMRTPASIIDALNGIEWKLPLIVMNGAALYDMKEHSYLATVPMEKQYVQELRAFFEQQEMNCFTNTLIDDLLVISYSELKNEAEQNIFRDLKRSPYRNFVRADLLKEGEVLYLMTVGQKEKMDQVYALLKQQDCYSECRTAYYPSTQYPGYMYLKIYHKNATIENMIERLRKETGLRKTMTFGSCEGEYDVVVRKNDSRKAVQALEKAYYKWKTPCNF